MTTQEFLKLSASVQGRSEELRYCLDILGESFWDSILEIFSNAIVPLNSSDILQLQEILRASLKEKKGAKNEHVPSECETEKVGFEETKGE